MLAEPVREVTTLTGSPTAEVIASITGQLLGLGANIDKPYATRFYLDNGKVFRFQPEVYDAQSRLDADQKPISWTLYGREYLLWDRFFKLNVYSDHTTVIEIITFDSSDDSIDFDSMKLTDIDWSI